jgi:hypothetical protein
VTAATGETIRVPIQDAIQDARRDCGLHVTPMNL